MPRTIPLTAIAVTSARDVPAGRRSSARYSPGAAGNRALVRGAVATLANWLGPRKAAAVARRMNTSARAVMPVNAQWKYVAAVVESTIRRGQTAVELHAAAALRIDSTEYEIGLLKHDLAGVLSGQRGASA